MHPLETVDLSFIAEGIPLIGAMMVRRSVENNKDDTGGYDAQWIDNRVGSSMQNNHDDEPRNRRHDDGSVLVFKWAHLGVTLSLLAFMFGQYEKAQDWARIVAVNTEKIAELRASDARYEAEIRSINTRLDTLAGEMRQLQAALVNHAEWDERRSRPAPANPASPRIWRDSESIR